MLNNQMVGDFNDPNWESRQHCMNCSKVVGPRRFGTASSPLLCFRRLVRFMMVFKDQREMELSHIYIYMYTVCMTTHVQEAMVQKSRLMRAVTSGVSTGGSLALAFKLLNWAERAEYLAPLSPFSHWTFNCPSFVLGLACGLFIFFALRPG